jgi:polyhydroxybutyrate depolymerase
MNRRFLLRFTALLALSLPQVSCRVLLRQLRPAFRGARGGSPRGTRGGTPKGVASYQIMVDGFQRTGLVHVPPTAQQQPAPVVFVFHGHGGSASVVASSFGLHQLWPEAIVIYLQGLNTPSQLDPAGRKPGWQTREGDLGDRDLHLFDAVLADLSHKYRVDARRVFATGHSNGGFFTYLLWHARSRALAAVAPSAATTARMGNVTLSAKPAMHLAGTHDQIVKFPAQQATMEQVKRSNHCDTTGVPWGPNCTLFPSRNGTPLVTYIYSGSHTFSSAAPPLIVRFFKEQCGVRR